MSMMYCEVCDKQIDTDFDAEHFDEHDTAESKFNFYKESKKYMAGSVPMWEFYLKLPLAYIRFKRIIRKDKKKLIK